MKINNWTKVKKKKKSIKNYLKKIKKTCTKKYNQKWISVHYSHLNKFNNKEFLDSSQILEDLESASEV